MKKKVPLAVGLEEYKIQCGTHKYFIKLCIMETKTPTENWQSRRQMNQVILKVDIAISCPEIAVARLSST